MLLLQEATVMTSHFISPDGVSLTSFLLLSLQGSLSSSGELMFDNGNRQIEKPKGRSEFGETGE
jgi:hypothetical protein